MSIPVLSSAPVRLMRSANDERRGCSRSLASWRARAQRGAPLLIPCLGVAIVAIYDGQMRHRRSADRVQYECWTSSVLWGRPCAGRSSGRRRQFCRGRFSDSFSGRGISQENANRTETAGEFPEPSGVNAREIVFPRSRPNRDGKIR